jgi:hypothetical protein
MVKGSMCLKECISESSQRSVEVNIYSNGATTRAYSGEEEKEKVVASSDRSRAEIIRQRLRRS